MKKELIRDNKILIRMFVDRAIAPVYPKLLLQVLKLCCIKANNRLVSVYHPTQPLKHRHRIYDDQGTQGATVPPPRSTRFSPPLLGTEVGDALPPTPPKHRPLAVTADRRDGQHEQGETPTNSCPSGRAAVSSLAADPMGAIATTHRARHRRTQEATVPPPRSTRFSPPLPGTAVGDPLPPTPPSAAHWKAVTADRRDGQHEQGETPTNGCPSGRAAASSLAADPDGAIARPTEPDIQPEVRMFSPIYVYNIVVYCNNIEAFPKFSKPVTWFQCLNCNIPVLDKTTYIKNFNGDTFNLSDSHIQRIDKTAFSEVVGVNRFYFDNNEIVFIEPGLFNNYTKLTEISFKNNKITNLQAGTFASIEVDVLNLSQNLIKHVAHVFDGVKLAQLNLCLNAITEIPENAFNGVEMWKTLYNAGDGLDLSYNDIQYLNSMSSNCSQKDRCFSVLRLHHNSIRVLENKTFNQLEKIDLLSLHSNQIEQIHFLNYECTYFENKLCVTVTNLEDGVFSNMHSITTLELQNNKISKISLKLFNKLQKLRTLDISDNSITNLNPGVFSTLRNLNKLNISHNPLRSLHPMLFVPLRKLNILDVSNIQIHQLDVDELFRDMVQLRVLNINDNFWTCEDLRRFYKIMNKKVAGFNNPSRHFDVTNFHGIACSNKKLQYYDDMNFEEFLEVLANDKLIEEVRNEQVEFDEVPYIAKNIYVLNCLFVIVTVIVGLFFLKFFIQLIIFILKQSKVVKN
ncbi:hypothetical protein FQR65_LT15107 [Abscondita terminalis]|nr:hypothetical protein FQR65_LT15107 [Abscondita terminalis]